jgi:hypothetical protein
MEWKTVQMSQVSAVLPSRAHLGFYLGRPKEERSEWAWIRPLCLRIYVYWDSASNGSLLITIHRHGMEDSPDVAGTTASGVSFELAIYGLVLFRVRAENQSVCI